MEKEIMTPTPERELVERLRSLSKCGVPTCGEAADRLESLEAERDGLQNRLAEYARHHDGCPARYATTGPLSMKGGYFKAAACTCGLDNPAHTMARMAKSILTAGYPRSQCAPDDPHGLLGEER